MVPLADGYLMNNEVQMGKPCRMVLGGGPMPDELGLMSSMEHLEQVMGCTVASDSRAPSIPLPFEFPYSKKSLSFLDRLG